MITQVFLKRWGVFRMSDFVYPPDYQKGKQNKKRKREKTKENRSYSFIMIRCHKLFLHDRFMIIATQ